MPREIRARLSHCGGSADLPEGTNINGFWTDRPGAIRGLTLSRDARNRPTTAGKRVKISTAMGIVAIDYNEVDGKCHCQDGARLPIVDYRGRRCT